MLTTGHALAVEIPHTYDKPTYICKLRGSVREQIVEVYNFVTNEPTPTVITSK